MWSDVYLYWIEQGWALFWWWTILWILFVLLWVFFFFWTQKKHLTWGARSFKKEELSDVLSYLTGHKNSLTNREWYTVIFSYLDALRALWYDIENHDFYHFLHDWYRFLFTHEIKPVDIPQRELELHVFSVITSDFLSLPISDEST